MGPWGPSVRLGRGTTRGPDGMAAGCDLAGLLPLCCGTLRGAMDTPVGVGPDPVVIPGACNAWPSEAKPGVGPGVLRAPPHVDCGGKADADAVGFRGGGSAWDKRATDAPRSRHPKKTTSDHQ